MHLLQVNLLRISLWLPVLLTATGLWSAPVDPPGLLRLKDREPAAWEEWRGRLVVFDFFAPWCLPCAGVSRELQGDIADYYRQRGGNPRGVQVEVVPVNIDDSNAEATGQFLRRAGLELAWYDPDGRLFEYWGGQTVPFLVVVDGATAGPRGPGTVLARYEGHPGVDQLRRVLDGVGGGVEVGTAAVSTSWLGVHIAGALEVGGELLGSDDVGLYQLTGVWQEKRESWDVRVQAGLNAYALDYRPAPSDFVSQPAELRETQWSVQARVRERWGDRWQVELQGGAYVGFADYRSLWLDEYYRQYFDGVPGYEEADPWGWNVAPGLRWELVSGAAWLQAGLVVQQDEVSPGYEKAPFRPLVRGTSQLDTLAGVVSLENVLTRSVRAQQSFRITDTTNRDLRYEYSLAIHWAVAERWVIRGWGGMTLEPPEFHAYQGQVGFERDWSNRWFLGLFGRYYTDDGLVRDPLIVSSASPPLETWQTGVAVRYESEHWQAKLAAGPYLTRYEPVPPISRHFSTLYADRDWLSVQGAVAFKF